MGILKKDYKPKADNIEKLKIYLATISQVKK